MNTITLSIDDELMEAASGRAQAEHSTVDELARQWLIGYAGAQASADAAMGVVEDLRGKLKTGGRKFTRDDMNAR